MSLAEAVAAVGPKIRPKRMTVETRPQIAATGYASSVDPVEATSSGPLDVDHRRDSNADNVYILYDPDDECRSDADLIPLKQLEEPGEEADVVLEPESAGSTEYPEMATTGNWKDYSTLEMPRETDYDRPPPGCRTSATKILGFLLFFGCNGLFIAYLVPLVLKAMLGI